MKKKILTLTPLIILSTVMAVSCNETQKSLKNDYENPINFNNKTFYNKKKLEQEISSVLDEKKNVTKKTIYKQNKNNIYFDNSKKMNEYIKTQIKENINVFSTKKQKQLDDLFKNGGEIHSKYINNFIFSGNINDSTIELYKGFRDKIYKNENEAKLSYFNLNQVFKFNGKFYSSKTDIRNKIKEELNNILSIEDEKEKKSKLDKFLVISENELNFRSPSGLIYEVNENVGNVINNELKKYIKIKDKIYEFDDLKKLIAEYYSYDDFNILSVNSNKGISTYIVDNKQDDVGNLHGKYLFKSSSNDIYNIVKNDEWHKIYSNFTKTQFQTSKNHEILNNFFTRVLMYEENFNKKDSENDNKIKNSYFNLLNNKIFISKIDKLRHSLDNIFLYEDNLKISLWNKLNSIIELIQSGKRNGILNQILITYNSGLSYLVKLRSNNEAVKNFKDFYSYVLTFIDDSMIDIFGNEFYVDENRQPLRLSDENGILDYKYDFNTDFMYYTNKFANSSRLMDAIKVFDSAVNNVVYSGGFYDFDKSLVSYSNKDLINEYKNLFERFSFKNNKYYVYSEENGEFINKSVSDNNSSLDIVGKISKAVAYTANNINNSFINIYLNKGPDIAQKLNDKKIENYLIAKEIIGQNKNVPKNFKSLKKQINLRQIERSKLSGERDLKEIKKLYDKKVKLDSIEARRKRESSFNKMKKAANIVNSASAIFKLFNATISAESGINKAREITKSVFEVANTIMNFLPPNPIVMGVTMALNVINIFVQESIGTERQTIYEFSSNSSSQQENYYWDGGLEVARFWGLLLEEKSTISDAKILKPIQIMPDVIFNGYYFNRKLYSSLESTRLNNDIAKEIYSGNIQIFSRKAKDKLPKIVYSLEKSYNNQRLNKFKSNNKDLFFDSKEIAIQNLTKNNNSLLKEAYSTDEQPLTTASLFSEDEKINVIGKDREIIIKLMFDNLEKKIQPIWIVQIPKISEKNLLFNDIYSKYTEVLDYLNNGSLKLDNKIIIYNPKKIIGENNTDLYSSSNVSTDSKEINKLKQIFWNSFSIQSKRAYIEEFFKKNNFNDIEPLTRTKLYAVTDNNYNVHYFNNYINAANSIKSTAFLDITKTQVSYEHYDYNGIQFNNKKDAIKKIIIDLEKEANNG